MAFAGPADSPSLGAARDGEARREGVAQAAVVTHVPAIAQVADWRSDVEDLRRTERLVVGQAVHHHLADHRPDAVGLGRRNAASSEGRSTAPYITAVVVPAAANPR